MLFTCPVTAVAITCFIVDPTVQKNSCAEWLDVILHQLHSTPWPFVSFLSVSPHWHVLQGPPKPSFSHQCAYMCHWHLATVQAAFGHLQFAKNIQPVSRLCAGDCIYIQPSQDRCKPCPALLRSNTEHGSHATVCHLLSYQQNWYFSLVKICTGNKN